MSCKKWIKRHLAILMAVIMIMGNVPMDMMVKVCANEEAELIDLLTYNNENKFEKIDNGVCVDYINTQEDSIAVNIELFDEANDVYINDSVQQVLVNSNNKKYILASFNPDTDYTIKVTGDEKSEVKTVKWIRDTVLPEIPKIICADEESLEYGIETTNILSGETSLKIYINEENLDKVYVNDQEITEILTEENGQKFINYTIRNDGDYCFLVKDLAGNECSKTIDFAIDGESPKITGIFNANSGQKYISSEDESNTNYIKNDTEKIKVFVTDGLSGIKSLIINNETELTDIKTDEYSNTYFETIIEAGKSYKFVIKDNMDNLETYNYSFTKMTAPIIENMYGMDSSNQYVVVNSGVNYTGDGKYRIYFKTLGGNSAVVKGVAYSTNADANIDSAYKSEMKTSDGSGYFYIDIYGINSNVTYYFWAYDINGNISESTSVTFRNDAANIEIESYSVEYDYSKFLEGKYILKLKMVAGSSGFTVNSVKGYNNRNLNYEVNSDIITVKDISAYQLKNGINVYARKNTVNGNEQKCTLIYDEIISSSNTSDVIIGSTNKNQNIEFKMSSNKTINSVNYKLINKEDINTVVLQEEVTAVENTYTIPIEEMIRKNSGIVDGNYIVVVNASTDKYNCIQVVNVVVDRSGSDFTMEYPDSEKWVKNASAKDIVISDIEESYTAIDLSNSYFTIMNKNGEINRVSTEQYSDCFEYTDDLKCFKLKLSKYLSEVELEDGYYTINFCLTDKASNSTVKSVKVNLSNAVVKFKTTAPKEWTNVNTTTANLVVSDIYTGIIGIGNVIVKIDGTDYSDYLLKSNNNYSLNLSQICINNNLADGEHSITTEVRNAAYATDSENPDNYLVINDTFKIDTKNPIISGISTRYGGKWISKCFSATINSTDENADEIKIYMYLQKEDAAAVDEKYVLKNGQRYCSVIDTPDLTNATDAKLEELSGKYECFFVAVDNAGNYSDIFKYSTVNFDFSKPKLTIKKVNAPAYNNGTDWYKEKAEFNYEITTLYARIDTESVIAQIESNDKVIVGSDELSENGTKLTGSMSVDTKGNWGAVLSAQTTAGVKNSIDKITFNIDKDNPYFDTSKGKQKIEANSCIDGVYYDNEKIVISGYVSDKTSSPYSGIKQTLLLDSNNKVVSACSNTTSYTFTLKEKKRYTGYKIKIMDNVGNYVTSKVLSDMVISDDKSDILISPSENYVKVNNKLWYSGNTKIGVDISNKDLGIASVSIAVNDKKTEENNISKKRIISNKHYDISTTDDNINDADCSYKVSVSVVDNAGNTSSDSCTVYKDDKKPAVSRFAFNGVNSDNVITTDYGYFFNSAAQLTVFATDDVNESGLKNITLNMVNSEGTTTTETKEVQNGQAVFNIPAGYKGQLYASAQDNVGNSSDRIRLAGTIIETKELHDKYSSISFAKQDTPYRDINNTEVYESNVNVTINIQEPFSGIASATWEVVSSDSGASDNNGSVLINNAGVITGNTDNISNLAYEGNIISSFTKNINVDANSNNILIKVTVVDNSGFVLTKTLEFSIDKTSPQITVSYDNNASDKTNTEMFNNNRVATVSIRERNFNPDDVIINAVNTDGESPIINGWVTSAAGENGDEQINTATIEYLSDGDYDFNISYTDKAGNSATLNYGDSVSPNKFTIDKTNPEISISFDNNNVSNGMYYQDSRTATIKVNEHNFSEDRVHLTITENGNNYTKNISSWESSGDIHTANIVFNSEALYSIKMGCEDMAFNSASQQISEEFVVDVSTPKLTVNGIADKVAYKSDKISFTVSSDDVYFGTLKASLYQITSNGTKKPVALDEKSIFNGKELSISNVIEDGIYKLSCIATDKSNKKTEQNLTFSVNRNGSTYLLGDYATDINNNIVKSLDDEVTITEINVDKIDLKKLSVILYYGTNTIKLEPGSDYSVNESGGGDMWSAYSYIFDKNTFDKEGKYTVSITSNDEAGNANCNEDDGKMASLSFSVDKTAPICSVYDLDSNKTYKESSKEVKFSVIDNILLSSVKVSLNGKELYTLKGDDLTEDNMKFTIDESTKSQSIEITYTDAAGNTGTTKINKFYVTTNMLTIYTNNNGIVIGSILVLFVLVLIAIFVVYKVRKKKH